MHRVMRCLIMIGALLWSYSSWADCLSTGPVCLPTGSLPFYQPRVDSADVDAVVEDGLFTQADGGVAGCGPADNRFRVRTDWDGVGSDATAVTWDMGPRTYFSPLFRLYYQRGKRDVPDTTAVQVQGDTVGRWMNSLYPVVPPSQRMDHRGISEGCWYTYEAGPRMFYDSGTELEVTFDMAVPVDETTTMTGCTGAPGAAAQIYLDLIVRDTKPEHCGQAPDGGPLPPYACPAFTFTVNLYDKRNSPSWYFHHDTVPESQNVGVIASSRIDDPNGWFYTRPGSQQAFLSAPEPSGDWKHYAIRITQSQFTKLLTEVKAWVAAQPLCPPPDTSACPSCSSCGSCPSCSSCLPPSDCLYASQKERLGLLSPNPLDYTLSHFSVIAEAYDPTDSEVTYTCGTTSDTLDPSVQLGSAVKALRVTSLIPHQAQSRPMGYDSNGITRVVYRTPTGEVNEFFAQQGERFRHYGLSVAGETPAATGSPSGYQADTARVVYRAAGGHIYEDFLGSNGWEGREIPQVSGSSLAAGDPYGFADPSNRATVVYRGLDQHIHQFKLNPATDGWEHKDLTAEVCQLDDSCSTPEAAGNPIGFVAGYASRVVFLGTDNRFHQFVDWSGWTDFDMMLIPGAVTPSGKPSAFVDSTGAPHIVYPGTDSHIHDLTLNVQELAWYHFDLNERAGATSVLSGGNPTGFASGSVPRVVYRDTQQVVQELVYDGANTWHLGGLSNALGLLPTSSDPVGFVSGGIPHVVYRASTDDQLHGLTYDSANARWLHMEF